MTRKTAPYLLYIRTKKMIKTIIISWILLGILTGIYGFVVSHIVPVTKNTSRKAGTSLCGTTQKGE